MLFFFYYFTVTKYACIHSDPHEILTDTCNKTPPGPIRLSIIWTNMTRCTHEDLYTRPILIAEKNLKHGRQNLS